MSRTAAIQVWGLHISLSSRMWSSQAAWCPAQAGWQWPRSSQFAQPEYPPSKRTTLKVRDRYDVESSVCQPANLAERAMLSDELEPNRLEGRESPNLRTQSVKRVAGGTHSALVPSTRGGLSSLRFIAYTSRATKRVEAQYRYQAMRSEDA